MQLCRRAGYTLKECDWSEEPILVLVVSTMLSVSKGAAEITVVNWSSGARGLSAGSP